MFLRKEKKTFASGTYLVPFCKECNSQNIQTIQKCKDCGSHNITSDWADERSHKVIFNEKEVSIYKCDKCGKEFDGLRIDNIISYGDGYFEAFKCNDEYGEYLYYNINEDLCETCKKKLTEKLNLKIQKVINQNNVKKVIDAYLKEK